MGLVENRGPADRCIRPSVQQWQSSCRKHFAVVVRPSEGETIPFIEIVIHPSEIRIIKKGIADVRNEVVRRTGYRRVRRRPKRKQCRRNRIGDGSALRCGRHSSRTHRGRDLAESFPRTEEKRLVFEDWSSERRPILITVKRALLPARLVCEEVGGIQRIVTQKFERRPM